LWYAVYFIKKDKAPRGASVCLGIPILRHLLLR